MSKHIFDITDSTFKDEVQHSSVPVLVEFGATWCPPCKMLEPIIDQLAEKYEGKLRVCRMDTDENPVTQELFGVMGIPTLVLLKDGQQVMQIVGYRPRHQIESALAPHL